MERIAVVRIRGDVGLRPDIRRALDILRLRKKHCCVIITNNPSYLGALKKVKDYVAFGELDKETFLLLLQKRGRLPGNKPLTEDYLKQKMGMDFRTFTNAFFDFKKELKDIAGLKLFFRLHPPIGGFGRAGIKKPYSLGGALGYMGKDINKLLQRMI